MKIGNDIVDLDLAKIQSNWRRIGYLDKIFTKKEQNFIFESKNQDEMVWQLWSRKEAVYKIVIQKGGIRGYYPLKMECLNFDLDNGIVCFEDTLFYTKTNISRKAIYSLALENKDNFNKIIEIKDPAAIIKIKGIPYFETDNKRHFASKTHHGRFEKTVSLQI